MSFIRYKKFWNQEYAYEITSHWDKKAKKPKQKARYLGVVVDKDKKIFRKTLKEKLLKEEYILDFGDAFLLHRFLEKEGVTELLEKSFGENTNRLLNLISYRLCNPSSMRLAATWQNGNAIKHLCKTDLSSQRISDLLIDMGEEETYRRFFKNYLRFVKHSSDGLVFDITAMPNQIHMPFTQWGYHDEDIDKQIKLMLVVDKASSMPLFFRYVPGNIGDVSTLKPTFEELKRLGITDSYFIFDAGFFSEDNIVSLQKAAIPFMVRLPSNRKLYKKLVEESSDLESVRYGTRYGKRALFIKKREVGLFGEKAFAYVVLDPERKGREIRKMVLELDEIDSDYRGKEFMLRKKGIMILISSLKLESNEVVPLYYSRNVAEQLFKFSKDDLKLLPLRVHNEESMRGYLLSMFITLTVFLLLRKQLGKKVTVEEALLSLRTLKAKVFGEEMIISEVGKEQRKIFEKLGIMVPKVLGI